MIIIQAKIDKQSWHRIIITLQSNITGLPLSSTKSLLVYLLAASNTDPQPPPLPSLPRSSSTHRMLRHATVLRKASRVVAPRSTSCLRRICGGVTEWTRSRDLGGTLSKPFMLRTTNASMLLSFD